jgi:hypothetical protein
MLKINFKPKKKKNDNGMAMIEALPVLFMVILVFNFSLGFFGAIHSGILNSIGSYNYTMETFRFRSNLVYFRPGAGFSHYAKSMNRVHGIIADGSSSQDIKKGKWPATIRNIAVATNAKLDESLGKSSHNKAEQGNSSAIWFMKSDKESDNKEEGPETPEIWIKTVYGICLNADCKKVN